VDIVTLGAAGAAWVRRAVLVTAVLCAVAAGTASASAPEAPPPSSTAGRQTYLADCATCHGSRGRGTERGPSLEDVGMASIDFMVRTGRMPLPSPGAATRRRSPAYSAEQQRAVIRYAASLSGGGPGIPDVQPDRGRIAQGGELYRLQCAACHSWAGNGGALVEREAPSVAPAGPTEIAEAVRTGPGTMPVFGSAAISDRQLDDLVAFTDDLDHLDDRGGWGLAHLGPLSEGAVAIVVGLGLLVVSVRWLGERR
jgi:ubiquinol-cytochrome c reductase cytochrome c subunit